MVIGGEFQIMILHIPFPLNKSVQLIRLASHNILSPFETQTVTSSGHLTRFSYLNRCFRFFEKPPPEAHLINLFSSVDRSSIDTHLIPRIFLHQGENHE